MKLQVGDVVYIKPAWRTTMTNGYFAEIREPHILDPNVDQKTYLGRGFGYGIKIIHLNNHLKIVEDNYVRNILRRLFRETLSFYEIRLVTKILEFYLDE